MDSLRQFDRRLVEGVEIGDQILDLLLVLNSGEHHLRASF
jgi:hypothetical protein